MIALTTYLRKLPASLVIYGSAALCTAVAAAIFTLHGPLPVVRGSTPLPIPTPLGYQVPVFLPFGILVGEFLVAWSARTAVLPLRTYAAQLAGLCVVAVARLGWNIPLSGHALLLAFFLLHQTITRRTRAPWRPLIGLAVLAEVSYFKLLVWDDAETLVWGLALGAAVWSAGWAAGRLGAGRPGAASPHEL